MKDKTYELITLLGCFVLAFVLVFGLLIADAFAALA